MKKSKNAMINIRKFMECYLDETYEENLTKKQRRAREELEVKRILGIEIPKKEKKRLKREAKHVLTHKGMKGYLVDHDCKLPRSVSFSQAKHQDYDGKRYVYVVDDTDTVIPYLVPNPLLEKYMTTQAISMSNTHQILKNRLTTLLGMALDYKEKGDIKNYCLVNKILTETRNELYQIYQNETNKTRTTEPIDYEDYSGPIEKDNRNTRHDKMYRYGRRK